MDDHFKDELDLTDLFKIVFKQKVTVILVTLIFTLIATGYAYSQKPIYKTSVSFIKEQKQGSEELLNIKSHLSFLYANLQIARESNHILSVSTTSNSMEKAKIVLNEVIDYLLISKNKDTKNYAQTVMGELERLSKLDKSLGASSGLESTISRLTLTLKEIRYFEILQKLEIKILYKSVSLILAVGILVGFILGLFVAVIRNYLLQERK